MNEIEIFRPSCFRTGRSPRKRLKSDRQQEEKWIRKRKQRKSKYFSKGISAQNVELRDQTRPMKVRSAKTSLPIGSKQRHRDTGEENEPKNRKRAKEGVSSRTKNLQTSNEAV